MCHFVAEPCDRDFSALTPRTRVSILRAAAEELSAITVLSHVHFVFLKRTIAFHLFKMDRLIDAVPILEELLLEYGDVSQEVRPASHMAETV